MKSESRKKLCEKETELYQKFALKHINALFCGSYLFTIVITLILITHICQSPRHDIEKLIENELAKHEHIKKDKLTEGTTTTTQQTKLPYLYVSGDNNNEQHPQHQIVQNERKIANNLANNHDNYQPNRRQKRGTNNLLRDNELFRNYESSQQNDEPEVEFFDPAMRTELERRDAEVIKKNGKGKGSEMVWLTSYSRIPYDAITGYCKAARNYCPPGPQGPPGSQGSRGNKGEIGFPGLDGRDGTPGEPGLDGVPGRAGLDGIPGVDGRDGHHGQNGKDGKDGIQGPPGKAGIQGEVGPRGLTGPRGRTGKPGLDGKNGIPGVNLWKVKVNGTFSSDMLIPPTIATSEYGSDKPRSVITREGDNLRLRCPANGFPKPSVEWIREDERTISYGAWEMSSLSGDTLNITKINRVHMGLWKCLADNGLGVANQTFQIDVYFAPLIRIRSQVIYADNGSTIMLECEVEAYPEPIRYWEKIPENRLIEQSEYDEKYVIETVHSDIYKATMRLNISKIRSQDYGEYSCICKNELGIARAVFHLQERNPYIMRGLPDSSLNPVVFGSKPPEKESFEDICGPPQTCPDVCPDPPRDSKCKDTVVPLYDLVGGNLEVKMTGNRNYSGLPNRTLDCLLTVVGKPVYFKSSDQNYGSWLRDPLARNDVSAERIWMTKENDGFQLFEFTNKGAFRNNVPSKIYNMQFPFQGNAHVVYNGYFYYYRRDQPVIVKYDLTFDKQAGMKELEFAIADNTNYLYTTEFNVVDFSVDDNGLWVIYSTPNSNHTIVSMLSATTLEAIYSLNISINHHKVGEMFIVCGVLYAIDSVTERNTKIRLALDLYTTKLLDVSLSFTNPFRKTTTVSYNHRNKELYSWDRGTALIYPVRYHEIGNSTDKHDDT